MLGQSYKDLIVWQKAMDLVVCLYDLTDKYPDEEKYGLAQHTRRSVVSIPSNIAEGKCRKSDKQFVNYLRIAYGSGAELGTQIEVAKRWKKTKHLNFSKVDESLEEVMKMLNTMMRKFTD